MASIPTWSILLFLLAQVAVGFFEESSSVNTLTPQNFDMVFNDEGVWMIEFYAPWCGHCKHLAPEWEKAAKALKGIVKMGAMDADKFGEFATQFGVEGYPTIKIFGSDKTHPTDYEEGRSASQLIAAGKKAVQAMKEGSGSDKSTGGSSKITKTNDVVELTNTNFRKLVIHSREPWLVQFFAPECGHCEALAPAWAKAATMLKGKVHLGSIDATKDEDFNYKYKIQAFPTIKFFSGGKSTVPTDYDGPKTADGIVQWALKKTNKTAILFI